MVRLLLFVGAVVPLALSGCSAPPPPPPPTIVNLTITTTADVNPSESGIPAPVAIRIYQLGSAANFNGTEFFQLLNNDAAVLKADLVHRDDFLIPPGQTKTETIKPGPAVNAIGVFAAFRDFQSVTWRVTTGIDANKTTNITVTAGHDGLQIKSEGAAPPKPGSR